MDALIPTLLPIALDVLVVLLLLFVITGFPPPGRRVQMQGRAGIRRLVGPGAVLVLLLWALLLSVYPQAGGQPLVVTPTPTPTHTATPRPHPIPTPRPSPSPSPGPKASPTSTHKPGH
ncbi:MAG TPA: hypothetical protein VGF67_21510 [Ktedonobacteraceae bacterium]|jgi:hypothetical protein